MYCETGWNVVTDDRVFRERKLPDGLEFFLYLDELKVILGREDKKKPQIFITSDGEISPFRLEITDHKEWLYQISFDETPCITKYLGGHPKFRAYEENEQQNMT